MSFVAAPAPGRNHKTERRHLAMERVFVGLRALLVAASAFGGCLQLPFRSADALNGMRRMATGADGCVGHAGIEGLAVGPLEILLLNSCMAGSARLGDIGPEHFALRIVRRQNFVRPVAACTCGRHQQPVAGKSKSVNGIDVERIDVRKSILLGHFGISVAGSASARQVQRIDGRTRVFHGDDHVRIPVTIQTGGRRGIIHHRFVHAGLDT